jgi:hypothetical protein
VFFDFAVELLTKCFDDFDGHHKNFMMLCNVLVMHPSFEGLLVLKF